MKFGDISNYATITGKRFFIVPNIMTRTHRKLPVDTERKHDLDLGFEFKDIDTVEIELPTGYESESIPPDAKIESKSIIPKYISQEFKNRSNNQL